MNIKGAIFKRINRTNENQPIYSGNVTDDKGVKHDLAFWYKNDKNGNPYWSFTLKPERPAPLPGNNGGQKLTNHTDVQAPPHTDNDLPW